MPFSWGGKKASFIPKEHSSNKLPQTTNFVCAIVGVLDGNFTFPFFISWSLSLGDYLHFGPANSFVGASLVAQW